MYVTVIRDPKGAAGDPFSNQESGAYSFSDGRIFWEECMRIVRFDEGRVGLLEGDSVCDVTGAFPGYGETWPEIHFIRAIDQWKEILPRLESVRAHGARKALADCCLLPPVLNPSKIVAAPVNYIAHKEEMLADFTMENAGFFLSPPLPS